ncbi:hypothetical protein SUGI_0769920 [Cryptomeria japonica]|nr:hypothetical protein SUGI_0769920 [Cryptomeria japonica]
MGHPLHEEGALYEEWNIWSQNSHNSINVYNYLLVLQFHALDRVKVTKNKFSSADLLRCDWRGEIVIHLLPPAERKVLVAFELWRLFL